MMAKGTFCSSSTKEFISSQLEKIKPNVLTFSKDATDYGMTRNPRGVCLIFYHEDFEMSGMKLTSADTDAVTFYRCFGDLGFDVHPFKDMTYDELQKVIKEFSKLDHSNYDCFVCCVSTHGTSGQLFAKDKHYPISKLLSGFKGDVCPTLAGKPKIFIIDACRGNQWSESVAVEFRDTGKVDSVTCNIPTWSDFLVAFSSVDGYVSFAEGENGSWYIQALTATIKELMKSDSNVDLVTVLTTANRRVAFDCPDPQMKMMLEKQMPSFSSTLTRRVIFKN